MSEQDPGFCPTWMPNIGREIMVRKASDGDRLIRALKRSSYPLTSKQAKAVCHAIKQEFGLDFYATGDEWRRPADAVANAILAVVEVNDD